MTPADQPAIGPRLAEDLIAMGERALRRARPLEHPQIEAAALWLLERVRLELREGR